MNIKNRAILAIVFWTINLAASIDKWIVVTTINYPTEALKKLASLQDWHLVVVADKKTPVDWHLDNCEFLSIERQEQLPFQTARILPWNHYSRKNLGYLYAISQGAKIIYETDDDNYLIDNEIFYLPAHATSEVNEVSGSIVANPYAYFGQPTVWPRGYPLKQICFKQGEIHSAKNLFLPIQQGLVNVDPDVDAIFRLTRNEEVYFKNNIPLAFKKGSFSPFNSQNTLYHYQAFWGLIIPISVSFRVSDIWRSYWVQRVLWDIEGSVCFTQPTANQYRNDHDLLKDFIDEYDLYAKSGSFISFLNAWKSTKSTLSERIMELTQLMIKEEFFGTAEQQLITAWLNDLAACGYVMPEVSN
jgi:STELLO glycosyltransferases